VTDNAARSYRKALQDFWAMFGAPCPLYVTDEHLGRYVDNMRNAALSEETIAVRVNGVRWCVRTLEKELGEGPRKLQSFNTNATVKTKALADEVVLGVCKMLRDNAIRSTHFDRKGVISDDTFRAWRAGALAWMLYTQMLALLTTGRRVNQSLVFGMLSDSVRWVCERAYRLVHERAPVSSDAVLWSMPSYWGDNAQPLTSHRGWLYFTQRVEPMAKSVGLLAKDERLTAITLRITHRKPRFDGKMLMGLL